MKQRTTIYKTLLFYILCILLTSFSATLPLTDFIQQHAFPLRLAVQSILTNVYWDTKEQSRVDLASSLINNANLKEYVVSNYISETITQMGENPKTIGIFDYTIHEPPYFFTIPELRKIFLDTKMFETLTPQEQQYIIGHEIVHIQNKHNLQAKHFITISSIAIPIALHFYDKLFQWCGNKIQKKQFFKNHTKLNRLLVVTQKAHEAMCNSLSFIPTVVIQFLLYNALMRHQEYEADTVSVQKLGVRLGAISALMKLKNTTEYQLFIGNSINLWLNGIFGSHPLIKDRIDWLKRLSKV